MTRERCPECSGRPMCQCEINEIIGCDDAPANSDVTQGCADMWSIVGEAMAETEKVESLEAEITRLYARVGLAERARDGLRKLVNDLSAENKALCERLGRAEGECANMRATVDAAQAYVTAEQDERYPSLLRLLYTLDMMPEWGDDFRAMLTDVGDMMDENGEP